MTAKKPKHEVKTEVAELPDSRSKITATVPAAEVERQIQKAAKGFAGEMKVPGFRKGKVPTELVVQRVGREAILEEALRDALPHWYERAILASGVAPVGEPSLDMPEPPGEGEDAEFTIEIAVRPKATLGDYKGLEVGKADPEVPAEAIDEEIDRMRESLAGLEPVERPGEDGDFLLIDYAGEIDGEPFEGGSATDFLLELGSNTLIEGFNETLQGASAGEKKVVELTFPDDYHAEHLAGKPAKFDVEVKEVRAKVLPDADDDFAADNSDFDTIEELREDIEGKLLHSAEHRAEHQFEDAVVDAVVENATVVVPEDIVNARAAELWERVERSLAQRGMNPETYLQMQGKEREEMIEEAKDDAKAGLEREAVLAAIVESEDFEVSEEEILEALAPPAGEKGNPEKLLARLREEGRDVMVVEEIQMRKARDLIVAEAKPIDMDRAEAREKLWTPG